MECSRYIDLHIHTTKSDGIFTPVQIVHMAKKLQVEAISITDHDMISGYFEALESAQKLKIELISGIEFSCDKDGHDVHLLGYFIDPYNKTITDYLNNMQLARKKRFRKIIEKLHKQGITLDIDKLTTELIHASPGRLHIARKLIEIGKVRSISEAFNKYLSRKCPAYIPTAKTSIADCISLIHSTDGVAILAHPGLYKNNNDIDIEHLISFGLDGIEVYHPSHTIGESKKYLAIAKRNNLKITGGSDFHGAISPHHSRSLGDLKLPYTLLEALRK